MVTPNLERPWNIVLAMDGSEHAQAAASLVRSLPLPEKSTVSVLAVFLPRDASNFADHEINVRQAQDELSHKNIHIIPEILAGYPAETISQYANEHQADLIVMGAKGLRATLGILLGGVAQQVVEYAHRPVLVVRAPFTGIKRVLLVVDGSSYGQQAVEYLAGFPFPAKTEVMVMHVLRPLPIPRTVTVSQTWVANYDTSSIQPEIAQQIEMLRIKEEKEGKDLLDKTVHELQHTLCKRLPETTVNQVIEQGDAATEIIKYVQQQDIDLIIAGSRGLGQIKSWLLGSVSRKLVHYSDCSTLIVRSPSQA